MATVILDGSNLCLSGQKEKRHIKTLGALLPCLRALADNAIEAYVIFDASFRWRLDKGSSAAIQFERLLREDEKFQIAPAGTPADDFILQFAALRGFGVVSNDAFRDYLPKRSRGSSPRFNGKPLQLHSFQMLMGGFIIPSLGISYLIDEAAVELDAILAARNAKAEPTQAAEGARPPASPPAPRPRPEQAPAKSVEAGPLDYLIELSPLMLRAGDLFEVHRKLTGKPWKSTNSRKGAEEFAAECFARPVGYRDVEGRKKNDGYFFDSRFSGAEHEWVRTYVTSKSPRIMPLIASERGRLVPILDLIHDEELAAGFTVEQLCGRADALRTAYYDRYFRAALYALIAVNGVLGENERQTNISTILKGRMSVNAEESSSDRLNFIQRGILYLLSDSDNLLPDPIVANIGWILQLPPKEKIRDVIIRGHLEWLAGIAS